MPKDGAGLRPEPFVHYRPGYPDYRPLPNPGERLVADAAREVAEQERQRILQEAAAYEASPEREQKRAEEARVAAKHAKRRGELVQRIHALVPGKNPRQIGSELDRFEAEALERLYHGGVEWGSIRPERQSDDDRAAKQAWDQLLGNLGYVQNE